MKRPKQPAKGRRCRFVGVFRRARRRPICPVLRGGEVVLIPSRVTAVVGRDLPALLREATLRDVAAVVFQRGEPRARRPRLHT